MAIDRDQIITLLRNKGPMVPNDIKRAIGGEILIFGAVLSELKSRGLIEITQVKKGGSPFYYLPETIGQVANLIEFLNPKDQVTVRRLQQEKVLNEANEELFSRVSFRNIPDFAKSFMIQTPQGEYRCWRYFLVSEREARQLLAPAPQVEPEPASVVAPTPAPKPVVESAPAITEEYVEIPVEKEVVEKSPESSKQFPSDEMLELVAKEPKESKEQQVTKETPKKIPSKTTAPKEKVPLLVKEAHAQTNLAITPELEPTAFYTKIIDYFKGSGITLHREEQLSKDREYLFVVTTPTAVGPLQMYAHARNKKKLNEGDVAPALLKAKSLDLPCIFLFDGEFTKKSLLLIEKEYKGIILKKLS